MQEKLKLQFPSQGWKQFLIARKEMLDAYDQAREKVKSHEVEVYHGIVAEATFRKWLSSFLPKRYGITSGYIVSPGLKGGDKTPHFDVIIYDQLESPVLWVEGHSDVSPQCQSLAIPVEYVYCVFEVKSNFDSATVADAMNHLKDLLPLMSGLDEREQPSMYKMYFPLNFCCGLVFFNLQIAHQFSEAALNKVIYGHELRGFFGGVILRGEGHEKDLTGRITLLKSKTPIEGTVACKKNSLLKCGMTNSVQVSDNLHFGSMLIWLEHNFSRFAFDIIAMIQGTFEVGQISSAYGMGGSGWENEI